MFKNLNLLLTLFRSSIIGWGISALPYIAVGGLLTAIGFGINKVVKEQSYKSDVDKANVSTAECLKKANDDEAYQKCYQKLRGQ